MVIARLVLRNRRTPDAMKFPAGASGLYKTVVTAVVESSPLYGIGSLLLIGPWTTKNNASGIFLPVLVQTQACAVPVLP